MSVAVITGTSAANFAVMYFLPPVDLALMTPSGHGSAEFAVMHTAQPYCLSRPWAPQTVLP